MEVTGLDPKQVGELFWREVVRLAVLKHLVPDELTLRPLVHVPNLG